MEVTGSGKSPNTSLSFRYTAESEELEQLCNIYEDSNKAPEASRTNKLDDSPKKTEKGPSIIDKYFKSMKIDKNPDKDEGELSKSFNDDKTKVSNTIVQKDITCSPVKEYLHRFSRKHTVSEGPSEAKEKDGSNETWKLFHDFKSKLTQAVEDIKHRSNDDKEKSLPRDSSVSDSEENSILKDLDISVGDTDNQVSSLHSSLQNLSEITPPATAMPAKDYSEDRPASASIDDTHKICDDSMDYTEDPHDESSLDVESGVEMFEDINIEGLADVTSPDGPQQDPVEPKLEQKSAPVIFQPPTPKIITKTAKSDAKTKTYFFNVSMYFLTFILTLSYLLFPYAAIYFCFGLWAYCFISNTYQWFVDTYLCDSDSEKRFLKNRSTLDLPTYTIPSIKEHKPLEKYQGWINHYRYPEYDPFTYHINKTTTAFIKLEGCNLRISYTKMKVPKRALWDEKIENPTFYQHTLYNLTGARVILMPKGLVDRRHWIKKYPICIVLSDKEKIQILEKESSAADQRLSESHSVDKKGKDIQTEMESTELNPSPERKKRFIWRRKEKNNVVDNEPEREGLRHRFVRKMHKEKKSDLSTPVPDPPDYLLEEEKAVSEELFLEAESELSKGPGTKDDDIDLDEKEFAQIKEFLDEAETEGGALEGSTESEWSVHVKHPEARHKYLFLFARTGREKHDWYRRFKSCIAESSKGSADSSAADEKSLSEAAAAIADKDEIEMSSFKLTDKDVVSFAKSSKADGQSEVVSINTTSTLQPHLNDVYSLEKSFWPFFFKIIQKHETNSKVTKDTATMCLIQPTPTTSKSKKHRHKDMKTPPSECKCCPLSMHSAWLNTLIARAAYDVMRDPQTIARLQHKIQRKLHTLKLPSFMSPLQVTRLSLEGACPLVTRVAPPAWDERGVWVDMDLRYEGGAFITILTQINLMKLKEKGAERDDTISDDQSMAENVDEVESILNMEDSTQEMLLMKRKPAIFNSDVEDSAESSSDDESPAAAAAPPDRRADPPAPTVTQSSPTAEGASSKKKFLRMVDRIATNKYFQTVTEYKYVKRAMEGLSNTDIKLQLDINGLEGTLAVNVPPPPHDRVWFGFRKNPQLLLKARPAFGARSLRIAHITNWIEQKLSKEFERILVLPNMEDIPIDVLTPTPVEFE